MQFPTILVIHFGRSFSRLLISLSAFNVARLWSLPFTTFLICFECNLTNVIHRKWKYTLKNIVCVPSGSLITELCPLKHSFTVTSLYKVILWRSVSQRTSTPGTPGLTQNLLKVNCCLPHMSCNWWLKLYTKLCIAMCFILYCNSHACDIIANCSGLFLYM